MEVADLKSQRDLSLKKEMIEIFDQNSASGSISGVGPSTSKRTKTSLWAILPTNNFDSNLEVDTGEGPEGVE